MSFQLSDELARTFHSMQEYGKLANKIYIETSKDGGPFYDLMSRDVYREGQEIGTRSQRNILNIIEFIE